MSPSEHQQGTRRLQTAFQLILYHITTGPWDPNEYKMLMTAWRTLELPILTGTSLAISDIETLAERNQDASETEQP